MIVPDASALTAALMRLDGSPKIRSRLSQAGPPLHVPEFVDLEFLNGLRRLVLSVIRSREDAETALLDFRNLPLRRYPHARFLDRIWQMRHNITAYDAAYVALAEALDAPLLTRDRRLADATGHTATIELI